MINNIHLTSRNQKFDFNSINKKFTISNFADILIKVLSSMIVGVERDMNSIVYKSLSHIKDEKLLKEVKAFIKQEGQHSFYHVLLNKQLIKQGYQLEVFKIERLADILTPNILFSNYKIKISCVSGGEQLIQVLGLWLLSNKKGSFIEKEIERFLSWHAIEELEHYHISFEICLALKINYFFRTLGFFISAFYVFLVMLYGIILFIRKDKLYLQPFILVDFLMLIFTRRYTSKILFVELVKAVFNNLNPFYMALNNNRLLINEYENRLVS